MKALLCFTAVVALAAQQASQAPRRSAPEIPESAGDDVRGYNDTPQLPGEPWNVHDMNRPRAPKVTPGQPVTETPPSDAIVLFDGKDLSQWVQIGRGGQPRPPRWKVENGYMEIVPGSGRLATKQKFGDCRCTWNGWYRGERSVGVRGAAIAALSS